MREGGEGRGREERRAEDREEGRGGEMWGEGGGGDRKGMEGEERKGWGTGGEEDEGDTRRGGREESRCV